MKSKRQPEVKAISNAAGSSTQPAIGVQINASAHAQ
jgi:hypothetical protein